MRNTRIMLAALLIVLAVGTALPAQAASDGRLTLVEYINRNTTGCGGVTGSDDLFRITYEWTATTSDDERGRDYAAIAVFDGTGAVISGSDFYGGDSPQTWNMGFPNTEAFPITFALYDTTEPLETATRKQYTVAMGAAIVDTGTPLAELTLDPREYDGVCAGEPPPVVDPVPGTDPGPAPEPAPPPAPITAPAMGMFTATAPLYYAPDAELTPVAYMGIGQTLLVLGQDASGSFYRVVLSGQPLWTPVESMESTYDALWNGQPLPNGVVD